MPDYVLPQPFGVPPIISILNPSCLDLALFFLCGIKQNSFCHIFVTFQSSVNFSSNTSCQVLLQRHWRRCPAETRLPAPPHGGKRRHLQIGQKQRAAAAGLRLFGTASHKMEPVLCRRQYWQRQRHAAIWSTDHTQPVNKRSSKPCCRPAPVTLAGTCSRQCRRQAGASAPARCLAGLCRRRHQP